MQLELNGTVITDDASAIEVTEALEHLNDIEDSFAILSQDEMAYIQTSGDPDRGFVLEYQDGSVGEHYGCYEDLPLVIVKAMFLSYLTGDGRRRREIRWQNSGLSARAAI